MAVRDLHALGDVHPWVLIGRPVRKAGHRQGGGDNGSSPEYDEGGPVAHHSRPRGPCSGDTEDRRQRDGRDRHQPEPVLVQVGELK